MAEKEERILCIETDEKIIECGYGDFYNTITRQEATDKMAEAIIREDGEGISYLYAHGLAEAALNALLNNEK